MKAGANSGKKQRLKLKVARSTQRSASRRTPSATVTIESQPAHDFRLKGVPTDLFTVFHVREAAYEVDKRIIAARQPLTRRSLQVDEAQLYQEVIDIPTRPAWTPSLKAKRLHELEEESFESYLTSLYRLYPPTRLNHFEHNLNVWRQLWRACEMSDLLILTADARHPLFHFPPSLYRYVTRDLRKPLLLVLNKVDLIDAPTLRGWVEWFKQRYPALEVVCFSSYPHGEAAVGEEVDVSVKRKERKREAGKRQPAGVRDVMAVLERRLREKLEREGGEAKEQPAEERKEGQHSGADATAAVFQPSTARRSRARTREKTPDAHPEEGTAQEVEGAATKGQSESEEAKKDAPGVRQKETSDTSHSTPSHAVDAAAPATAHRRSNRMARLTASTETAAVTDTLASDASLAVDGGDGGDRSEEESDEDELVTLHAPAPVKPSRSSILIVGVVGHPNAGKSSLINALFGRPVVSASETPGHTKHLQTLALTPRIAIVDAPGLVFPAVDMPRELQVLCGIFPITQLREPYTAIAYLAERVPLEKIYALKRLREDEGSEGRGAGRRKEGEGEEEEVREVGASLSVPEDEVEWSAWELCEAYARQRGLSIKGSNGRFDTHKAAHDLLHDVLSGVIAFSFKAPMANSSDGRT